MKQLFMMLCSCLLITACSGNKTTSADAAKTTTEAVDMHNAENSLDYIGTYTGTIPAADASGIDITLTLNKDKTFTLISEYIGKKDGTFKDSGTYSIEGNIITAQYGDEKDYYKVGENTMTMLDSDKKEITGDLAKLYILHKKQ